MKIKKILSLILSAVMALSASITAFSTESVAEFSGDEYTYAGELIEGWNIVCEKVAGKYVYAYYSVKVENDGYYKVVYGDDTNSMSAYILLDISDNYKKIHGEDLFWNEYTYKSVYHLEKGEYIALVCDQLEILPPETAIGRLTGDGDRKTLLAPLWSMDKRSVLNGIDKELARRSSYQGIKYCK